MLIIERTKNLAQPVNPPNVKYLVYYFLRMNRLNG